MNKLELLQEANKRGILPESKRLAYEEAVKRGLIKDQPKEELSFRDKAANLFKPKVSDELRAEGRRQFEAPFRGIVSGLENAGTGIIQTAADLGADFVGVKKVLSTIRPELKEEIQSLTSEDISNILGEKVAQKRASNENQPTSFKVGEFVGEVAPYITSGTGVQAAASKVLPKLAAIGLGGATAGAVTSGLEAKEPNQSRIKDTAVGGATGLVLAPTLSLLGAGVGKGISKAKSVLTKGSPEQIAQDAIQPETARRALQELKSAPQGKPTAGIDIQDPEFQQFSRSVVSKFPQSRQILQDFAEDRNKQAFARIDRDLNKLSKTSNADEYLQTLKDTKTNLSSPLYKEADSANTVVPKFEFLQTKTTINPQKLTVSEGVRSSKIDSSTKTKSDFIDKFKIRVKRTDNIISSPEEQKLINEAKGMFDANKDELLAIGDRYKEALKDLKTFKPKNPLQIIKEMGGISDFKGELKNIGLTNKTLPGLLRKEGTKGSTLDDVGEKLYEQGFFQNRPTTSEVLDFLDDQLRITNISNRTLPTGQVSDRYIQAKQFLDEADSLGIDIDAINKLRNIEGIKAGSKGIKAGSNFRKTNLSSVGQQEFQRTARQQTTTVQEGEKIVDIRKNITNLDQLNPKERQLASKFEEIRNSKLFNAYSNEAEKIIDDTIPDNSLAKLHRIRERIDANNNSLIKEGKISDTGRYRLNNELRNKINDIFKEVSPQFREADKIYTKYSAMENAVNQGRNFQKLNSFQIKRAIKDIEKSSGLPKEEILKNYRIGARDALAKELDNSIKFEGSDIPVDIQAKKIIESKLKQDKLRTIFPSEKSFNEFVNNINQEVLYNKTIRNLGIDRATAEANKSSFLNRAFGYLVSQLTTGSGKTGAVANGVMAGESILLKNYKNLNQKNATKLARILINRNASQDLLESVLKKADPAQKDAIREVIKDSSLYLSTLGAAEGLQNTNTIYQELTQ